MASIADGRVWGMVMRWSLLPPSRGLGWTVALIFYASAAIAADIKILRTQSTGTDVIVVSGQIEYGDDYRVIRLALDFPTVGVVVLSSPGGSLDAGLLMARAFRGLKYSTLVPPNATCASACALAWLGGVKRFLSDRGRIGFHAAHIDRGGVKTESGVANALVGGFLNEIRLSQAAVIYITQAPPDGIQWLTKDDAAALGIELEILSTRADPSTTDSAPAIVAPPPLPRRAEQHVFWRVRQEVSQGIQNVRRGPGTMHKFEFSIPAGSGGINVGECRKPDTGGGKFDWRRITWNGKSGWTWSNGLEVEVLQR